MRSWTIGRCALALAFVGAPVGAAWAAETGTETDCADKVDNDADGFTDCADSDCYADAACAADGGAENTDARCSDWIDNDGNGHVDCDDNACYGPGVTVCQGSWDAERAGGPGEGPGGTQAMPELPPGASFEDMIGKMGDVDGERNDQDCSDGVDNDGDGYIDCADFGCRFDPSVTVCREQPGMRFSVVSFITAGYDFEEEEFDVIFRTLQARVFGPIPLIQDSFFLLSMRLEKTPRLSFAMFQVPLGGGHFMNINSGGGGLSSGPIRSASKQLLVEQPFYLYSAFEQGNGAAIDIGGPVTSDGKLQYRTFLAGGSGRFAGNVGGRFFSFDNTNFTWSLGAQLSLNLIGFTSRWDSPMLYTKVPTALGFVLGFKYDQRAQERYPAMNAQGIFRSGQFIALAETYVKRELEFESWQYAYNLQLGYLLVPKHLLLAADIGQFIAGEMTNPPAVEETDIRRQNNELQWRVGLHWYYWRSIGVMSLIYTDSLTAGRNGNPDVVERTLQLTAQYRF